MNILLISSDLSKNLVVEDILTTNKILTTVLHKETQLIPYEKEKEN